MAREPAAGTSDPLAWTSAGHELAVKLAGVIVCVYQPQGADVQSPDSEDATAETTTPVNAVDFGPTKASVSGTIIIGVAVGGICP